MRLIFLTKSFPVDITIGIFIQPSPYLKNLANADPDFFEIAHKQN